jgi:hypothetical protein
VYERPVESTEAPNSSQLKELLRHLGKTGGIWGPPGKSKASKMVFWWFSGGFLDVLEHELSRFQMLPGDLGCQNMSKHEQNQTEPDRIGQIGQILIFELPVLTMPTGLMWHRHHRRCLSSLHSARSHCCLFQHFDSSTPCCAYARFCTYSEFPCICQ